MINMIVKASCCLLFFALSITTVFSQKYSNEFLNIGVGARAQAMGGANIALVMMLQMVFGILQVSCIFQQTYKLQLYTLIVQWDWKI